MTPLQNSTVLKHIPTIFVFNHFTSVYRGLI